MNLTPMAPAILIAGLALSATTLAKPPQEPAVELHVDGKDLKYTYDLSGMFDKKLWSTLERNHDNEITVEVRLLDAKDKVRVAQYHHLRIELLSGGRLKVGDTPEKATVYKSRSDLLAALTKVPGKPIKYEDFAGVEGHLEVVVLVNPVQVYSFPDADAPVADQKVVPQTYFDRKVELRSRAVTP